MTNLTASGLAGPVHFSECWKCGGTRFRFHRVRNGTKSFQCSSCLIYRADSGNDPGRHSRGFERRLACRLYEDGMTSYEISLEIDRDNQSILNWVREAGIQVRTQWIRGRSAKFRSYESGCVECGGEVVADHDYFICLDCGKSNQAVV